MNKMVFAVVAGCMLGIVSCAYAEDAPVADAADAAVEAVQEAVAPVAPEVAAESVASVAQPAVAEAAGVSVDAVSSPVVDTATPVAAAPQAPETAPVAAALPETVDNLEFISGEVSVLDEASKSVSVKMYGETENASDEKVLKVTVDENTDITDGEQDRDLKSLAVGTEVDVEYDPSTNKATYIFVY